MSLDVLILGAGELGTAVLSSLAQHPSLSSGMKLSVLLRPATISTDDDRKRREVDQLRKLGIGLVPGDIHNSSENELTPTFAPFDTIVGCTGMYSPPGTQLKLTRSILAAGVKRYIPWQFGVDYDTIGRDSSQDLFTEQLDVRDLLRRQERTSWVIVSTGIFTTFLFEDVFGVVTSDRITVRALGGWENKVTVTDVADIGRMVAEVVLVETNIQNEVIFIAGDTLTYAQLAQEVEAWSGIKINREEWSIPKLLDDLNDDPDNGIKKYRVVFAEGRGVAWDKEQTLNVRKDIELQNVRSWLQMHQVTCNLLGYLPCWYHAPSQSFFCVCTAFSSSAMSLLACAALSRAFSWAGVTALPCLLALGRPK